jgi:GntR family transcriptional regulator
MITFRLDTHSGMAPYLQIVQQVKQALRLGRLKPGDQMPTVREVVASLTINPNTVMKAYRELEREGLLVSRPGIGIFVQRALGSVAPATLAALRHDLTLWVQSAREAGLDDEDVHAIFQSVMQDPLEQEEVG